MLLLLPPPPTGFSLCWGSGGYDDAPDLAAVLRQGSGGGGGGGGGQGRSFPPPMCMCTVLSSRCSRPCSEVVSRATPSLRRRSGTLQCNGLFQTPRLSWGASPQTCMWFVYCATACTLCSHYQPEQSVAL